MIRVKKDWWKDFFNHIYLLTDARSVCDNKLTCREVDLIEETLQLDKGARILDLCGGQGRHSIELAKRGYRDLTVFDYSDYLINLGKRLAKGKKLRIKFLRGDARSTKLSGRSFSAIILMANSFGYFPCERENIKVLKEICRLLEPKGELLLDLTDYQYVKNNLKPMAQHIIENGIKVLRKREIKDNLVKIREIVSSKKIGVLRDACYCERFYNEKKITQLLIKTSFKNIKVRNNLSFHNKKQDYGFLTSRMFVSANK